MIRKLVETTSSGLFGPFDWRSNSAQGIMRAHQFPMTFFVKIDGDGQVVLKGAAEAGEVPLPVNGGEWTESTVDALYTSLRYFWLDVTVNSGTVTVWIED